MEISLLFLFFIFSIIIAIVAYLFESHPVLLGSAIICLFLAYSMLSEGYSTNETQTSVASFGYNNNSQLVQVNVTGTQLHKKTQDNLTYATGLIIGGFGFALALLAIGRR